MGQGSFLEKLFRSILGSDSYILIAAIITVVILWIVWKIAKQVEREVGLCHNDPSKRFVPDLASRLNTGYNLFTTMITIFPLLGMFGTVRALININLNGQPELFRQEFFGALTSTAWGIIFAVIFKVANAFCEYQITSQIEAAEKIIEKELADTIKNGEH